MVIYQLGYASGLPLSWHLCGIEYTLKHFTPHKYKYRRTMATVHMCMSACMLKYRCTEVYAWYVICECKCTWLFLYDCVTSIHSLSPHCSCECNYNNNSQCSHLMNLQFVAQLTVVVALFALQLVLLKALAAATIAATTSIGFGLVTSTLLSCAPYNNAKLCAQSGNIRRWPPPSPPSPPTQPPITTRFQEYYCCH